MQQQRRPRRRVVVWAVTLLVMVVAVVIGWHSSGSATGAPGTGAAATRGHVGLAVEAAGLLLAVTGLIGLRRARRRASPWPDLPRGLTRQQLAGLRAQVLGQRPLVPAELPVVRVLARRMVLSQSALLLFAGIALLMAGTAVAGPTAVSVLLAVVFGATVTVASIRGPVAIRHARRFLRQHPEQEHPERQHPEQEQRAAGLP